MTTNDLRFARPHDLELSTSVAATKLRHGRLKVATSATIAETDNPEGGDQGTLRWESGSIGFDRVYQTPDSLIWHEGILNGERPDPGQICDLQIDPDRRRHNEAHHSFSHLLTAICCDLVSRDVIGVSNVLADHGLLYLREATDLRRLIPEVWDRALTYLGADDPVQEIVQTTDDALARVAPAYRNVIPANLPELRLVRIGHDLRWIPCRGVHVKNLDQIEAAHQNPLPAWEQGPDLVVSYHLASHSP